MTDAQRITVNRLVDAGFKIIAQSAEIVRVTRGSDRRIVMADGSQKRAHHSEAAQ